MGSELNTHKIKESWKPGLAMEREARDHSYAFALYGYLLRFFRTGELYREDRINTGQN